MTDDPTRRDLLKAAGLALAALAGAAHPARAQEQEQPKDKEEEPEEPNEPNEEEPSYDDLFGNDSGDEETRACPQCGALMYRQGNTWTCDTCGYSYVE